MTRSLEGINSDALLVEVARRGLLNDLHGAIGALYDNLSRTGVLDSESRTMCYLAYRVRREEVKLSDINSGSKSTDFWQQKIDDLTTRPTAIHESTGMERTTGSQGP